MSVVDIHVRSLRDSADLSAMQARYVVSPQEVIRVLNREKISFVLVGLHGISGWMKEPRGTKDVDCVVAWKHIKKATKALSAAFPHLEPEDHEVVVRFRDPQSGEVVIDLMKPSALYRETFNHTCEVSSGKQRYRIPNLEMALTMKFAAMLSPNRAEEDRLQDAHDFILLVKQNSSVREETLAELGEHVFTGGGKDVLDKIRKVRAGEKLIL